MNVSLLHALRNKNTKKHEVGILVSFFFEKWWTHDPHLFNGDIVAVFETRVDSQLESSILWAQGLDPLHLRV